MVHPEHKLRKFESLYLENVAVLIRYAMRYVSPDIAEDMVHEVYLELWKDDHLVDRELKFSYLLVAVRNKCINYAKQKESRKKHLEKLASETEGSDDQITRDIIREDENRLQKVYDQIEELPAKCRMIFKMAYMDGKKSSEIAEVLNLSIRTVEHQLYLGLKTIREKLRMNDQ